MGSRTAVHGQASDFRRKSTLGLVAVWLVLLTPFALNNFIQGRLLLGVSSAVIEAILLCNYWGISRNRSYEGLTLFGLVPVILCFLVLALRSQGMVGVIWCYPALLSFYLMLPERKAWLANVALVIVTVPQAWLVIEHPLVIRMAATLVATSIFSAIFIWAITDQQYKMQVLATTDSLTGLYNRTTLAVSLEQAIAQHSRLQAPMTLLALDIDYFKTINDKLGHDAGDEVLHGIGMLLRKRFRLGDKVFRLGGEEFLVLLHGTDGENGRRVAEELRAKVESLKLLPDRLVTLSVGVAALETGEKRKDWLRRVDEQLYLAKAAGRNRVMA